MLKKFFNCFVVATTIAASAVVLTSCEKESTADENKQEQEQEQEQTDELIGTWYEDDSSVPYILRFNQDNSGTIEYSTDTRASISFKQYFRWSKGADANSNTFVNILTTSGDQILEDGKYGYTIIGNMMQFGGLRFTRY